MRIISQISNKEQPTEDSLFTPIGDNYLNWGDSPFYCELRDKIIFKESSVNSLNRVLSISTGNVTVKIFKQEFVSIPSIGYSPFLLTL